MKTPHKPEPKPNFIHEINVEHKGEGFYYGFTNPNVRFEFDAETHKLLKVEMI